MSSQGLSDVLIDYDDWISRNGLDFADDKLQRRYPELADDARQEYRRQLGDVIHHADPGLDSRDLEAWYLPKPDYEMPRWNHAKSTLGLSDEDVERTGDVADKILARLAAPWSPDIKTRGLVLGHVQSGKTTNFLSVAAKAADVGYDLIIVLAGVHNSLRRQTQDRAARTLVHRSQYWWLGTAVSDFRTDGNALSTHLSGHGKRGLLVVKKHQTILERLANRVRKFVG